MKVTENGSFNIFNKSQEFRFTPEGLFRRKGRKSGPSKEDEDQLSFKVWHRAACAFKNHADLSLSLLFVVSCMSGKMLSRDSRLLGMQISDKDVQIIKQVGRGASSVVSFLHTGSFPISIKQTCMMRTCSSCHEYGCKIALRRSTKPTLPALGSMWQSRRLTAMSGCVTKLTTLMYWRTAETLPLLVLQLHNRNSSAGPLAAVAE